MIVFLFDPKSLILIQHSHLIIGFTPDLTVKYKIIFPELVTVLFWPFSFDQMQIELLEGLERPYEERKLRYQLNEELKLSKPNSDIELIVRKSNDLREREREFSILKNQLLQITGRSKAN